MVKFINDEKYNIKLLNDKNECGKYFNNYNYKIQQNIRCCYTCKFVHYDYDWISYCDHPQCIKTNDAFREVNIMSLCDNYEIKEKKNEKISTR